MEGKKKKGIACEHCDLICVSKAHLEIHSRTHSGIKPFKCSICGKAFSNKGNCKRHELGHAGERPFECAICYVKYSSKGALMKHLQFHTGENLLSCKFCDRKFTQNSHLKIHIRIHTGEKPFKCSSCDKSFSVEYNLKMHKTVHEGRVMPCRVCGKTFNHLGSLRGHMLRHTQKKLFKCPTCGIDFEANRSLKVHMRIHTGEKPFKCSICNKAFNRESGLRDHSQIHVREKANRDAQFGKALSSDSSSKDHKQQQYNSDCHFCDVCHKRYANKYSLNQHMKVHADNPLRCTDCKKVFTSVGYLKKHEENRACHMKKYRCPFCDRVFIKKVNIIIHVKSTHASEEEGIEDASSAIEKSFKCSICKQSFSNERSRIWHDICIHKSIEQINSDKKEVQSKASSASGEDSPSENESDDEDVYNFVEVSCDMSEDENTRNSIEENGEDALDAFPENSIFIKEESVDEGTSESDFGKIVTKSSENNSDSKCLGAHPVDDDDQSKDPMTIKEEKHDDISSDNEEY